MSLSVTPTLFLKSSRDDVSASFLDIPGCFLLALHCWQRPLLAFQGAPTMKEQIVQNESVRQSCWNKIFHPCNLIWWAHTRASCSLAAHTGALSWGNDTLALPVNAASGNCQLNHPALCRQPHASCSSLQEQPICAHVRCIGRANQGVSARQKSIFMITSIWGSSAVILWNGNILSPQRKIVNVPKTLT